MEFDTIERNRVITSFIHSLDEGRFLPGEDAVYHFIKSIGMSHLIEQDTDLLNVLCRIEDSYFRKCN